jgi:hypothetical protein
VSPRSQGAVLGRGNQVRPRHQFVAKLLVMKKFDCAPARLHQLLLAKGHKPVITRDVLKAALELVPTAPRNELVSSAQHFFRFKAILVPSGLQHLPSVWLRDLPTVLWNTRKPHWSDLPYMICDLQVREQVICVAFAQEQPNPEGRFTAYDRIRIELNLGLRPNLWTALPPDLEKKIWSARPDLRAELFQLQN